MLRKSTRDKDLFEANNKKNNIPQDGLNLQGNIELKNEEINPMNDSNNPQDENFQTYLESSNIIYEMKPQKNIKNGLITINEAPIKSTNRNHSRISSLNQIISPVNSLKTLTTSNANLKLQSTKSANSTLPTDLKDILGKAKRESTPITNIIPFNNDKDNNHQQKQQDLYYNAKSGSRPTTTATVNFYLNNRASSVSSNMRATTAATITPFNKSASLFGDTKINAINTKQYNDNSISNMKGLFDFDNLYKELELLDSNNDGIGLTRQKIAKLVLFHTEYLNEKKLYLSKDEIDLLEDYEKFMLGTSDLTKINVIMSSKNLKNMVHLNRIKESLLTDNKKNALISLLRNRKNLKVCLSANKAKDTIEVLSAMILISIDLDDLYLLLETILLIGDTFMYFGDGNNATFAYNQLRMACEICDNLKMKIKALLGLAEVSKKMGFLEKSLLFLKRALQFAWKIKDTITECEVYDKMGVVYYQMGEIEKASFYHERCLNGIVISQDSELVKLSNEMVDIFRSIFHSKEDHITPVFFTRLQIPNRNEMLKVGNNNNNNNNNPHLNMMMNMDIPGTTTTTITTPTTIINPNMEINTMPKLNSMHNNNNNNNNNINTIANSSTIMNGNQINNNSINRNHNDMHFSTKISPQNQLDIIFAEPDFTNQISSPRSHLVKDDKVYFKYEKKLPIHITKNMNIHQKNKLNQEDKNYFYVNNLIKNGVPINYKDLNKRLQMRQESKDFYSSFDTLKKSFKSLYVSTPVQSTMLYTHMTPNRNITEYNQAIQLNNVRYRNFYYDAIEHILRKANKECQRIITNDMK